MPIRRKTATHAPIGEPPGAEEPSFTALLKRLGAETGELVRAEVALAKLEFRDIARQAAIDGAKLGAAAAFAFTGVLALLTWGVLGLGDVLGGRYGTAALLLGVILLATGAVLARTGMKSLRRGKAPEQTVESIQESGRWIVQAARDTTTQLRRPDDAR